MDGLIIKKHWLDLILSGEKTWEIRGNNTKKRGKIALIESGSGTVVGTCEIENYGPVTMKDLQKNLFKHRIYVNSSIKYKKPHAWILKNAEIIEPVKYTHPQGAQKWVKDCYFEELSK